MPREFIASGTIISVLKVGDLGDLVALAAIKVRCRASLPSIADDLGLHARTVRKRVRILVELGFITEREGGRGQTVRDVVELGGDAVEFSPDDMAMGDAFAVHLLLMALGGTFTARLDDVASVAGVSRDTLDKHLERLRSARLVELTRVSRSQYRVEVKVPAGTTEKSAHVRLCGHVRQVGRDRRQTSCLDASVNAEGRAS